MISDRSSRRPSGPATRPSGPVLAAAVLLATAVLSGCSSGGGSSSPARSRSAGSTWSVASQTGAVPGTGAAAPSGSGPATGATGPASQPSAEASRDGVPSSVAALPPADRIREVPRSVPGGSTRRSASDGVWMISRPSGAPAGYGELLHLDGAGERILRAYPFARLAPQWLLVTPRAVYCGRHGDAAAPDAMVCRVDRSTGQLQVRVTAGPGGQTTLTPQDVAGRPGTWVIDDRNFTADLGTPPTLGTELTFRSPGAVLRLDPDNLQILGS